MSLSEQDYEQLESYVDGELSTTEEDTLRTRLDQDVALAAALAELRAERELRSAVWKSYEPDEAAIQRLIGRVDKAVDREVAWTYRLGAIRRYGAAAACIVLGILIGRVGQRGAEMPRPGGPAIASNERPGIVQPSPQGQPTLVSNPIRFRIVNEDGQPVGEQQFNSPQEANQFFEDINRWQRMQDDLRNGGGMIVPNSERF
jgi:hypothetical protein